VLRSITNPSIGAGELAHKIEIQQPQTAPGDSFGQSITPDTWNTVLTVRAAIEEVASGERSEAGQLVSESSTRITIRWTPTFIGANFRVLWGTRVFAVHDVTNLLERNRVLVLSCSEVNQQA
jgi:SPP1 family predicted phage head-tail adaptor